MTTFKRIIFYSLIMALVFIHGSVSVSAEETETYTDAESSALEDLENKEVTEALLTSSESGEDSEKSEEETWYRLENLGKESDHGDFVIGPGRFEIKAVPGQAITKEISITNRISDNRTFEISFEDVKGSNEEGKPVMLLGEERGPYTLKDYIDIPDYKITLDLGERAWVPVTILIPSDAEPGGFYGSVLISTLRESEGDSSSARTPVIAKVGTLFYVTVEGDVETGGELKSFETKNSKKFFSEGPIDFRILFENTGSVHLTPNGEITVKNFFGEEVGVVEIDPWYILPKTLQSRDIIWDRGLLFGRYTAYLSIDRGYDENIDEAKIVFWVFPWKFVGGIFIIIFAVIFFFRFIFRNFEFRRKT